MATHDYVLANQSGSSFRTDLNNALAAVVSNNSNSSEPSTTYAYMLWVDSTNNLVKLRNSSNNGWVTLFTTAGGLDVDAASNFNEDVTFTGASYNLVWDKSDNALEFADNAKALFGSSGDVEIFHDGSNSWITNSAGNLYVRGSDIRILGTNNDNMLKAVHDGTVELYFDGTKVCYTASNSLKFDDNKKAIFGAQLEIYHDGSSNIILANSGDINIRMNSSENSIVGRQNGSSELYYDNVKKLNSASWGINIVGQLSADTLSLGDSEKLLLGASEDLKIYHDSANIIESHNGFTLYLNKGSTENMATFAPDGAVSLFYDHAKKVYTSANGLQFDDNIIAAFGNSNDMQIWHSPGSGGINYFYSPSMSVVHQFPVGQSWTLETTGADKRIVCPDNGDATSVRIYHNGSLKIETTSSGCTVTGTVTETSDIALKTNIEPLDNVLEKLKQITGYKYQFKDTGHNSMGVTAQDVEKVFPELVHGEEGEKTLQYSGLIGALVESVKELSAKVAALEAK
tara:strand:- start:1069 stop:2607 length:1539 start_codon:yes stop_codon:yes gene_type:complete